MGFSALAAKRGNSLPVIIPTSSGRPSTSATRIRMFMPSSWMSVSIDRVCGLSQP